MKCRVHRKKLLAPVGRKWYTCPITNQVRIYAMKKARIFAFLSALSAALTGCHSTQEGGGFSLWPILLILLALALAALAGLRVRSILQYNRRRTRNGKRRRPRKIDPMTWCMFGLAALLLLGSLLGSCGGETPEQPPETDPPRESDPIVDPISLFVPQAGDDTHPNNFGIRWEIFENGAITHTYNRENPITFGKPEEYFALPGVAAFRGNNYRDSATYGTAHITDQTISLAWIADSTKLPGGIWEGSGWTGQPLVVKWDDATKAVMNLYESKKNKADLVEVIYATLDGHIYFLDLEDGSRTRDPINMGMCFKGSGSLDPRGYPLMYVGSGDENVEGKRPRMFVISLIDGKTLYQYGHEEALSYREDNDSWCAFDSSPLVDAETDTLIWPGENGLLYTIKLNTQYDKTAGTISVTPDKPVCTRYLTNRNSYNDYWLGYEASCNIVGNYLYVSENGGLFYCVDLNTMELVWAQDTKDDSNSSPVFEWVSETEGYIYTAPSLHWTKDANSQGSISIYKINALTGEIVWEKPYHVHTVDGVSGGVQSTPLLGKVGSTIDGLIIYTVSRTPDKQSGVMVALDTKTGSVVWTMDMAYYTWSSPVALYTDNGTAYVVVCDTAGNATLVEGKTGKVLSKVSLGGLVEASPVAYGNMLVVGTRGEKICGIKVS